MPSIRINDYTGASWQIDSSNPVVIGAWLVEVCGRICSANTTINHPVQVRIDVWPSYHNDPKTGKADFDWIPGGESFVWNGEQLKLLHDILMGIDLIPKAEFDKNGVKIEVIGNGYSLARTKPTGN